jgi:DMSO/TMAO reductase YedYZ molybdopterin-dependent catalytic subunit
MDTIEQRSQPGAISPVAGLMKNSGAFSLHQIASVPNSGMNTRHCCVEGWSMISKLAGTPSGEFLRSVGVDPAAKPISAARIR